MLSQRRMLLSLLLAAALATVGGCSYFTNRYNDLKDIGDFGVTVSGKPQFAAYASGPFVQVAALGYGNVDGHFLGLGEGRVAAWAPTYEKSYGLGPWGREWITYYHTEEEIRAMPKAEGEKAANEMQVGIVGMPLGWAGEGPAPGPDLKYFGSCPHYLHLGWVGVVATPRYLQLADFLLGWTTLDLCQDDNRDLNGDPPRQAAANSEKTLAAGKNASPAKP